MAVSAEKKLTKTITIWRHRKNMNEHQINLAKSQKTTHKRLSFPSIVLPGHKGTETEEIHTKDSFISSYLYPDNTQYPFRKGTDQSTASIDFPQHTNHHSSSNRKQS